MLPRATKRRAKTQVGQGLHRRRQLERSLIGHRQEGRARDRWSNQSHRAKSARPEESQQDSQVVQLVQGRRRTQICSPQAVEGQKRGQKREISRAKNPKTYHAHSPTAQEKNHCVEEEESGEE